LIFRLLPGLRFSHDCVLIADQVGRLDKNQMRF
jgi:hypothetical protein